MGICEAVGVSAGHPQGPWKSAGLGRVQICANGMCSTPASLSPALRTVCRKSTAPTRIRIIQLIWSSRRQHVVIYTLPRSLACCSFSLRIEIAASRLFSVAQCWESFTNPIKPFPSFRPRSPLIWLNEGKATEISLWQNFFGRPLYNFFILRDKA